MKNKRKQRQEWLAIVSISIACGIIVLVVLSTTGAMV